ncbi:dipeptide ABC transporter ATP-binding protein [Nocardia sp. NPDC058176]|uniref:dipeptide ABC transporter ATP-binding protein n=1 Tax=Nocardia sp. NPDC058176 TaxID=3346368 RepID=UPI0036D95791
MSIATTAPAAATTPATTDEILLDVRGLRVAAGEQQILRGIDLSVRRGEFLAIVGESGSGKTTLVNTVLGLLPPGFTIDADRLDLAGLDLRALTAKQLNSIRGKRIGYVPQDPGTSLVPVKTVGAQVGEIFRLHRRDLSRAEVTRRSVELLERVGIDNPEQRLRQYPHQLSGGQRQRVLIAIAFALDPEVLIADEPTSALDATVQQQVMEVFAQLALESNTTVLFITHDIALATDYATRLVVLKDGAVLEDGSLESVVVRSPQEYTRFLLRGIEAPPARPRAPERAHTRTVIEVSGLDKVFALRGRRTGTIHAVKDVSFQVAEGTTFALVGESGSGKSTTARLILGLERPTGGSVRLSGTEIDVSSARSRRALWRNIQLVHQNPYASLNPRDSVAELVSAPLRAHRLGNRRERAARVTELLDFVALPAALAGRKPAELSGGQRQRVAVARALALQPKILVLDEPTSALDVVTQAQVIDLLRRLQRELDLTYLFISHDLVLVRDFADHTAVLSRGELVEQGSVDDVLRAPRSPQARALVDAEPGRRGRGLLEQGRANDAATTEKGAVA